MSPELSRGRSVSLPLDASKLHLTTWFVTLLPSTFYKDRHRAGNVTQLMMCSPNIPQVLGPSPSTMYKRVW